MKKSKEIHLDSYILEAIKDWRTPEYIWNEVKMDMSKGKKIRIPKTCSGLTLSYIKRRLNMALSKTVKLEVTHVRNYYPQVNPQVIEAMRLIADVFRSKSGPFTQKEIYSQISIGSDPFNRAIKCLVGARIISFSKGKYSLHV